MVLTGVDAERGVRFLLYIYHVNSRIDADTVMRLIEPVVGTEAKETIMTIAERLKQEGFEKGREQGREQERRALVARLLERRFGPLPAHLSQRVSSASGQELERWVDRVLDATDLDAVFRE